MRQFVSPKRSYLLTSLHGVKTHNSIVILTPVKTLKITACVSVCQHTICCSWSCCQSGIYIYQGFQKLINSYTIYLNVHKLYKIGE